MAVYPKYQGKCVTCRYYDLSPIDRGYQLWIDDHLQYGFECSERRGNHLLTESCSNYKEDPYVSNSTIEEAENWLRKYTSYRFYIISTICEILKLPVNHPYMEAFNKLRNFSFTYPNGIKNLYLYDKNGVKISNLLLNEYLNPQKKESVVILLNEEIKTYLDKFASLILKYGNYQAAINVYKKIIELLADRYYLNLDTKAPSIKQINTEQIGKCRKLTLKGIR